LIFVQEGYQMMSALLEGTRVLDFSTLLPGPPA
jgi:crotonobetainyl-CoA:carnitine CoA-transferase CaiB-like acyl-CoA transferase